MSNPTFVFSLGAWVVPSVFDSTRSQLEALGYASACPAHPSIGAEPPTKTLADDVSSLRQVLSDLAGEGRDLVVVAHSYGGVVASCAVEGLSKISRAQAGKPGGVVRVIYLAAFALDKGQSLLSMLGGNYLPWMKVEGDYVLADGAGNVGWQDVPVEAQEKWNAMARHTSRAVFSGESTFEPWTEIPCSASKLSFAIFEYAGSTGRSIAADCVEIVDHQVVNSRRSMLVKTTPMPERAHIF